MVFSVAAVFALAHAVDDAILLPGAGVPLFQHGIALAIALVTTLAAVARFESMRPGLRAATAFTFGVLATLNGGRHAHHIVSEGVTANDVTGVLALGAGVVLIALAAWIPFRHRGERTASPFKRWAIRAGVVAVSPLVALFVHMPVGMAIIEVHSLHRAVGSPPSAAYEPVHLTTSDGLELDAWYHPSRTGAAVLMMSGGSGDIRGTLSHARMLVRHGYGVLLFSGRGTGDSGGTPNSYGWGREKDAAAALDYLATREDVQPGRVGALGLSTGADMAIDIAARRTDVNAVVADGTAAIGYEDLKEYTSSPVTRLNGWLMFKTIEAIQGTSGPDVSLADQIARMRAPSLLIAAGEVEKTWGDLYDHAGGERSHLWHLPHASHTAALRQYPREYERRVVEFFDVHLGGRGAVTRAR
ncbi:alpha/beta hydrolase [Solirubrobacter deserti]|uniref:CocE/NonD family hydrolase n=1 Tax=Solirubrobacter deserti TaxID=2282478 RepID=A0ABT4RK06_9ACTN|nr:CocE/NonD family hydrolase [Solirubrobacter deserti]MDA0138893.1 CocE/NonD family hydrolase [Solirubrobacter deserti]